MGVNIVVPPVHDLKSALVSVHEYRHGIDVLDLLGKEMPEDEYFEERAKIEESNFIKDYVRNK